MHPGLWRARINTVSGETLGAGFLIDQTRVLTCAHVVNSLAEVRVTFPGGPGGLNATVELLTHWAQPGDLGDMAVSRLEEPVTVTPARFATPAAALYQVRELRAYGFRRGFEMSGSYVTLRTAADMVLSQEWWQLDVDTDGPERLMDGFSGAAVYLVSTGDVIGMVTDADREGGGRMGRMLPLSTLRRHWEDLDELLPLPWLTADDRRALCEIVRGATAPLRQVYLEAFPGPPPQHEPRSVWDAIRYVAEERFEEDRLSRFLGCLGRHLPEGTAERLATWSRRTLLEEISAGEERMKQDRRSRFLGRLSRHLPEGTAARLAAWRRHTLPEDTAAAAESLGMPWRGPTSIIIRLERRTRDGAYELMLSTLVDGVPGHATLPVEVCEAEVRKEVERHLPTLLGDVLGHDWMIEFALPESWLSRPVEEWKAGDTMMLAYPVVVRDIERLKPTFRQDRAIERWRFLRQRATTMPESVECENTLTRDQFFYWLTAREDVCVLVHAQRPRRPQLTAALNAGIPVMLWPRSTCPDLVHVGCTGERVAKALTALIAETHPDNLPRLVKRLRAEARSRPESEPHYGRRLTLLWDDPARLPDPPLAMPMSRETRPC